MLYVGNFVKHTLCSLYETHFFCKPVQREDKSYNLPMGQSKFRYELISIVNGCKQNDKDTLKVEVNQFVTVNAIP